MVVDKGHRRSMRCRLGVAEGAVGKAQSLVDLSKNPQCDGVPNLRCGARIMAEPVGEIGMARLVIELDGFLKMAMSAGVIAEIPTGGTGSAVCDHSLRAIRLGRGFAQEKLGHFAHRCGFATGEMPHPKTEICGEPLRGVFLPAGQFAGARKGGTGFRRVIPFGPRSAHCQG